ncbi:MAG: Gfo/Idh/MocA family oxidoreductase [Pirellulaceae bacterium]|nr:Gfo/Idh/MocA family oxidoreductase [Pirellulaceae bacterium]
MTSKLSRRSFLAQSTSTLAASSLICHPLAAKNPSAANDRINLGIIGLGSRGYNLIDDFLSQEDCRIVAICDVDVFHYRDRPWGTGTAFGRIPAKKKIDSAYANQLGQENYRGLDVYEDFRELIARDDIDAVVVATPDHWHALCTLTALKAGKDVYCEKPVTHLFAEGQLVYREVAKQKAVFQTGSQQRSDWRFRRAVELARNGVLGSIEKFDVGLPPGYDQPMGETAVSKIPKQLNYDFWCGPSQRLPYMRARHHRWWRGHRAYGGGVLMDWIGHHNDIAHWAIDADKNGPSSVEAVDWKFPETDVYNTPRDYTIRSTYDGGIEGTISTENRQGLKLIGTDGWVFVTRGVLEASDPRWVEPDFDAGTTTVYRSDHHARNFLDCMRSRQPCIAPAQTAHRSITPGHLGYVSHQLGRKLAWDAAKEVVVDDDEANRLLQTIDYRDPWSV